MTTIFVSKDGNDSNDGLSIGSPKLTLAAAYAEVDVRGSIVFLTPWGEWAEDMGGGGILLDRSFPVHGIDLSSWDPARPATIRGISGPASITVRGDGHRFNDLVLTAGTDTQTVLDASDSAFSLLEVNRCRVQNPLSCATNAPAGLRIAQSDVRITDTTVLMRQRSSVGIWLDGVNILISGVTVTAPFFHSSAYAVQLRENARNITILSSRLVGNNGVCQTHAISGTTQLRIVDSEVVGKLFSMQLIGATESNTLKVITRNCRFFAEDRGALIAGDNTDWDDYRSQSMAGNVAIGCPTDGTFANVTGNFFGSVATAFDPGNGHAILSGVGSVGTAWRDVTALGRNAVWGVVAKGIGSLRDSYIEGGTADTVLYKGGIGWEMTGNTIVQGSGGTLLDIRNGDPTPIASGLVFRDNTCIVSSGTLYTIGEEGPQHDGTLDLGDNVLLVSGAATWGDVGGALVNSLADLQSAGIDQGSTDYAVTDPLIAEAVGIAGPAAQTLQIVFDYDGQPVSGVIVRVAGREITSDMLGRVVIDLDPGTYTVKYIVPPNYQTPDEDEITIDTDPVDHAVTLQTRVFPPLDPPLCSCTILAILQDGTPAVDAIVTVHVRERGALDNTAFLFNHEHEYLTDADGLVTIPMLRNHRYDIVVEAEGQSMRVRRLIPDADHYHILVR